MFKSLKIRLTLWILLPTALLLALDLYIVQRNSENIATSVQEKLLLGSANMMSDQIVYNEGEYEINIPPAAFELFKSKYRDRIFYSIHSSEGQLIFGGDELPPYDKALQIDEGEYFQMKIDGEPVRAIAFAHMLPNSSTGEYVVIQVAQTLRGHGEFRNELFFSTLRGHLLLLSVTVIVLFMTLRWTLSPLVAFSERLTRRKPGALDKMRVDEAPSELEPIIHALNAYIEKLGQTLSAYEKFVSDTAHHLRTSFAIIQSQVDFGRRNAGNPAIQADTFDSIQKTMSESTKLVNQFLVLASVEQTANDRNSDGAIRLTEAITCVIEEMAPLALRKDISLGVDRFDDSLLIAAKPHFVREIFSNLIDNSIQHMGRPGSVTITLEREGQLAHCRLTDDGIGIPPPLLDRIFERFFRADTSQSGRSGLGLAIVKEICDALGATIQASIPSSGAGVQFDLFFPLIPGKPQ